MTHYITRIHYHFTGLLGEVEGVWEDVDVSCSLQLVSAVGGDVELYVISLQQSHLGLCVLLAKWQLLVVKTNPGTDATWQRVVLWEQVSETYGRSSAYCILVHTSLFTLKVNAPLNTLQLHFAQL